MERPRGFRLELEATGVGKVADIGSNDQEFWFWVKDNKDKAIYVCDYKDVNASQLAVTYQPDWIIEAMGLREIDPTRGRDHRRQARRQARPARPDPGPQGQPGRDADQGDDRRRDDRPHPGASALGRGQEGPAGPGHHQPVHSAIEMLADRGRTRRAPRRAPREVPAGVGRREVRARRDDGRRRRSTRSSPPRQRTALFTEPTIPGATPDRPRPGSAARRRPTRRGSTSRCPRPGRGSGSASPSRCRSESRAASAPPAEPATALGRPVEHARPARPASSGPRSPGGPTPRPSRPRPPAMATGRTLDAVTPIRATESPGRDGLGQLAGHVGEDVGRVVGRVVVPVREPARASTPK